MDSIKNIYKIGHGPSSSHTMAPQIAATKFKKMYPDAIRYTVELFGSLALTGKGHLADKVLIDTLGDNTKIIYNYDEVYTYHPNALKFKAYSQDDIQLGKWLVFSVGGGELKELNEPRSIGEDEVYKETNMTSILNLLDANHQTFIEYIDEHEDLNKHLTLVWNTMKQCVEKGLKETGVLPGKLALERRSASFYKQYLNSKSNTAFIYAAALAVSEENASGNIVTTAPTCGSSGVLPAVLYYGYKVLEYPEEKIINALKIAGLIGLLAKTNASISGAEVGCQGEVGVACSMAAAAFCYLKDGTNKQIEYAAEIGLEHHLGLTCDPVNGEVQIPCIERNAIAATKAIGAAKYALLTDGVHIISLDQVFKTMMETGLDLSNKYKETSIGGLAKNK